MNELFKDKDYSWIYDEETKIMYFDPYEVLRDCDYKDRAIEEKVQLVPNNHKRLFTNNDIVQPTVLNRTLKISSNYGKQFVTVYALIDLLQGRKAKATEIKNWLIYEVLPQINDNGYYIHENITDEQLEKLQNEISRLKYEKLYGSTEIVKLIKVPNLLSSSLYVYMSDILKVGTYGVKRGNKNRTFKANSDFDERAVSIGIARRGKGNSVLFFKEFAERINNCEDALLELKKINIEELKIKDKAIENRKPF